jgi:hypothetical protein
MKHLILFENFNQDLLSKSPSDVFDYYNDYSGFNSKEDAIEELEYLLEADFPYGFKNIPQNIILYRVLLLDNNIPVNEEEVGHHFISLRENIDIGFLEKIGVWDEWSEDSVLWLLECETTKDNLDIEVTIGNRLLYPRENEFTLKNPNKVKITNKSILEKSQISY